MEDLEHSIDHWIQALDQYDLKQLCSKPSQNSWSMGQLYRHLIADTGYYIEQIRLCLDTNEHATEESAAFAQSILHNNGFPDQQIKGDPSHASIPQPTDKKQLITDLQKLKEAVLVLKEAVFSSQSKGKTKHPGLGYFSAREWYRFADLHFRHHLKQKNRIDHFLETVE